MSQLRELVPDGAIVTGYNNSGSSIAAGLGVRSTGSGADQIALPAVITNPFLGVLKETAADQARIGVQIAGTVIATSGAAITRGAIVECGTDGKFVTHTSGTIAGVCETTTTAADQSFELRLTPGGAVS